MKLLDKSDKEILEIAQPIWDNLVKSSNIKDYFKGNKFGKFRSESFPTAEEYIKSIGGLQCFLTDNDLWVFIKISLSYDTVGLLRNNATTEQN